MDPYHEPVLVEEVLASWPGERREGRFVDGTAGGGGHAEALLQRAPGATLVGFDRDPDALAETGRRLAVFGDRVRLVQADYADMENKLGEMGGDPPAGILLDLGVSSHQIDDPARGFSYLNEGPLRMTLDRDARDGAGEILKEMEEGELVRVFRVLGELPGATRAARSVLAVRDAGGLRTTADLTRALERGGLKSPRRLSQAFQALRLHINGEIDSLERGLAAAARVLPAEGTLTVISFESLMDRTVKRAFRPQRVGRPHPGEPEPLPVWELIHRRLIRPGEDEVRRNPRSRSARLRAARRTEHDASS